MHAKLSVIIPVARMAGRFARFSNFLETIKPGKVELIVILDEYDVATSNELAEILSRYTLLQVKFLKGHFGSPGAARNAGLQIASCEWIWFCDADDEPNLDIMLKSIESTHEKYELLVFKYSKVNEISGAEILFSGAHDFTSVCLNPGLWRFLFRLDFIKTHKFENFSLGEDQLFLIQAGVFNSKALFIDQNVYKYSFGGNGHLVNRRDKVHDLLEVLIESLTALKKVGKEESKYISLLALRQFLTIIKVGSKKMKYLVLLQLLQTLKRNPSYIFKMISITPTFLSRKLSQ